MADEKTGLIYQKIPDIMSAIDPIRKARTNREQGFKFRSIDDVYNELHDLLAKHRVFTLPEIISEHREERKTAKGYTLFSQEIIVKYTFFAEDGSYVHATVKGEAMDSGDKASGKAQSYAHKAALLQAFMIPTDDETKDPDYGSPPPIKPKNKRPAAKPQQSDKKVTRGTPVKQQSAPVIKSKADIYKLNRKQLIAWLTSKRSVRYDRKIYDRLKKETFGDTPVKDITIEGFQNFFETVEEQALIKPKKK